jgi:predicted CXXCH cytochrome family protein
MCHDKKAITGKKVDHAPVKGGMCTSCHYPHQSDSEKLLISDKPDICFNCHDKTGFSMQNVHPPVAAGMCMECHRPHTAAIKGLLAEKSVTKTCKKCHTDFDSSVHVLRGLGRKGHPVDIRRKIKGKKGEKILFSCVSCHNPHSTNSVKLFRFEAAAPADICKNCHYY